MARNELVVALTVMVAAPSAAAAQSEVTQAAPAAGPNAQYCLRIEAITGTRLEEVKCWTRQEWREQEVDVDEEWAKEGVSVISDGVKHPARG